MAAHPAKDPAKMRFRVAKNVVMVSAHEVKAVYYTCWPALQAQCNSVAADVQKQQEVNRQLMSRKQEIEWQLMTALAGHPGIGAEPDALHDALLSDHNFDLAGPVHGMAEPQMA